MSSSNYDFGVVLFNGPSGSGKSRLANFLWQAMPAMCKTYSNAAVLRRTAAHASRLDFTLFDAPYKDTPFSELSKKGIVSTVRRKFPLIGSTAEIVNLFDEATPNPNGEATFTITENMTPRNILQLLGASNEYYPRDTWVNGVTEGMEYSMDNTRAFVSTEYISEKPLFLVTDLRYPHEFSAISDFVARQKTERKKKGVIVPVRLEPVNFTRKVEHHSEHALENDEAWQRSCYIVATHLKRGTDPAHLLPYMTSKQVEAADRCGLTEEDISVLASYNKVCECLRANSLTVRSPEDAFTHALSVLEEIP